MEGIKKAFKIIKRTIASPFVLTGGILIAFVGVLVFTSEYVKTGRLMR